MIDAERVPLPPRPPLEKASGSIVVVVATDAPLLPHQCERLALRAMLGVARMGGAGESVERRLRASRSRRGRRDRIEPVPNEEMNPLFYAAIEATEEAIVNALLAAETMTGRGGATVYGLEPSLLADVMNARSSIDS